MPNFFGKEAAALCLSGGGIRSASFCLGVVQGLAKQGLLSKFHFLSTVSGGGYLGSLIAAHAYRSKGGIAEVEAMLSGDAAHRLPLGEDAGERTPVSWWRENLSYLAPRRGLLSLDSWTLATSYARNLIVNALVWLPLFTLVLLLPISARMALTWSEPDGAIAQLLAQAGPWAALIGAFAMVLSAIVLHGMTGQYDPTTRIPDDSTAGESGQPEPAKSTRRSILDRVAHLRRLRPKVRSDWVQRLLLLGAFLVTFGAWWARAGGKSSVPTHLLFYSYLPSESPQDSGVEAFYRIPFAWILQYPALRLGLLYALFSMLAAWMHKPPNPLPRLKRVAIVFAGGFCGLLAGVLIGKIVTGAVFTTSVHFSAESCITLMPLALVLAVSAGEILFVAMTGKWSSDIDREWWARTGARSARYAIGWAGLCAVGLYLPGRFAALTLDGTSSSLTSAIYAATLLFGSGGIARIFVARARSSHVEGGERTQRKWRDVGLEALAALSLLLIVTGVASLVRLGLCEVGPCADGEPALAPATLVLVTVVVCLALFLASRLININRFSLHAIYRDRLIRTFLGATRLRDSDATCKEPDPNEKDYFDRRHEDDFTGLDRHDNPVLHWLAPGRRVRNAQTEAPGPLLIMNAALNLVDAKRLAWQERKAASFTFSPLHVGSASGAIGYRPSRDYASEVGGITLGTAMAVSGAAVSPNAGSLSSPVRTFLLTLFNARLGWWLGHPKDESAVSRSSPRNALLPMVREFLGLTNDQPPWIFVSDGGHFENLGLYEMVRRNCKFLVVVDAGCDPSRSFDDLGNAIRKVRIDFGVSINRVGGWNIGGRDLQEKGAHWALFDVVYSTGESRQVGKMLYIKPSLYPRAHALPMDVLQYARRSAEFPHESTADQFFTESQFESYRALGEFQVTEIVRFDPRLPETEPEICGDLGAFIERARLKNSS